MSKEFITSPEQIIDGMYYALPHEIELLKHQINEVRSKRHDLSGDIKDAMEQSSETWHDNAPADALFSEMRVLDSRELKLAVAQRNLDPVDYPDPSFGLVTIGSRVGCVIGSDEFEIDIAGNLPIMLEQDGDVEVGSVVAPMPLALLGASVGELVCATIGSNQIEIAVVSIDQEVQRLRRIQV